MPAFLATIITIVSHTPLWVWPLYALLLFLAGQGTRARVVPLFRVLILPVVVTVLTISTGIVAGTNGLPTILVGFTLGSALGFLFERDDSVRRLPDGRVWLRGEWWSFGQLALVLVVRYAIAIVSGMSPMINGDPTWHSGSLLVSTALSAIFLGRTARKLRAYTGASLQDSSLVELT